MKNVIALAVCLFAALAIVAAQELPRQQQPTQKTDPPELTLTGCLVQGSSPAVFIFQNVRRNPKDAAEPAVKYMLVAGTEDLNFRAHVNHEVLITGKPDKQIAPRSDQKVEEKDLPKLTASALVMVSNTCSEPR